MYIFLAGCVIFSELSHDLLENVHSTSQAIAPKLIMDGLGTSQIGCCDLEKHAPVAAHRSNPTH